MLRSGCLAFVLATASIVAWSQAAPAPAAEQSIAAATAAEQKVGKLVAQRTQLAQRYQGELDAIDRLKKEKASWRRDREVGASMADAKDTASQLAAVAAQLQTAQGALARARRDEATAVDAELAAGVTGPRATKLEALRAQLQLLLGPAPKKIVIPDAEIDPLADPEELEQRAAALREIEDQLSRQEVGLDQQAKDLTIVADLRKQHERAVELGLRDDDTPHRDAQHSTGGGQGGALSNPTPTGGGSGSGGTDTFGTDRPQALESEAVVLGEVIDQAAIESLMKASKSGDPATRAEAAKRARDAVGKRLAQLKKKRAEIELRAKQLRSKP